MKNLILLSTLFYYGIQTGFSQAGKTDPAFGIDGVVKSNLGKHSNQTYIYNGTFKILLGNNGVIFNVVNTPGEIYINKRYANGHVDSSYGTNGFSVITAMNGADALLQPDGKILVCGTLDRGRGLKDFALTRYTANGALDSTFSGDGMVTNNFGTQRSEALSVALQDDGKIVVAGTSDGFMLSRYNGDGSIDNSFSADGNHTIVNAVDVPRSVVIQKDGKIIVSGFKLTNPDSDYPGADFGLSRYNSDGRLDTTFAKKGNQITSFQSNNDFLNAAYAYSAVIQKDGKIIVGGYLKLTTDGDILNVLALARYNNNGNPDSTFGINGKLTTDATVNFESDPVSVALQTNGKILLGATSITQGRVEFAVTRFNTDGSTDHTFSGDGIRRSHLKSNEIISGAIAVQKDGKILQAGTVFGPQSTADFGVTRYTIYGSDDSTFGNNGTVYGNLKQGYTVYKSTAVQKDGKIVTAGYTWDGEKFIFAVSRFNTNGSPDSSFSGDGTKTTSFSDGDDMGNSVAIQADGKIIVAGSAGKEQHRQFAFARYTADGEPDSTFSGNGKQEVAFGPNGDDYANAVSVQADGKIVGVGVSKDGAAIVRLTPKGNLDATFGGGDGKQATGQLYTESRAVALQKDGKIVVSGYLGGSRGAVLARYTGKGQLDTTFGENGLVMWDFPYGLNYPNTLAIQNDGKIVIATNVMLEDESYSFSLIRYTPGGKIDSSFGENGIRISGISDYYVNTIALENDGKILAAGYWGGHSSVSRIQMNGIIDSTFGINGTQITQLSGYSDQINSIAIDNNSLYAAGSCRCAENLGTVIKYRLNISETKPLVKHVPADRASVAAFTANDKNPAIAGGISLQISPNPAHSILNINTTGFQKNKSSTLSLISSSGVTLRTKPLSNLTSTIQLDISSLARGMYIIKMISGERVMYKQFVKM